MDNALKFDKVDRAAPRPVQPRPGRPRRQGSTRSVRDRRKADPKFQKQEERIKKIADRKARHAISLNEEKFRAEFVPEDEKKDEAKAKIKKDKDKKKKFTEHPAWEPDFYNDEVLRIVADYLTLGSKVLASAPVRVGLTTERLGSRGRANSRARRGSTEVLTPGLTVDVLAATATGGWLRCSLLLSVRSGFTPVARARSW